MLAARFSTLLILLLLLAGTSRAQSGPTPATPGPVPAAAPGPPEARQLTVNVELPKTVSLLSDCAKIIFSRQDDGNTLSRLMQRFRARPEKQVMSLRVEVPTNKVTKTLGIIK